MTIKNKIIHLKLEYDINRDGAKLSVLSSKKIEKYKCFTGEQIVPFDQKQMIRQAKLTDLLLKKMHLKTKQKTS